MKESNKLFNIFIRYFIILIAAFLVFYSNLFYSIFLVLTIYPVGWLLSLSFNTQILFDLLVVNGISISLISACVAISAYFLLFILNLGTSMSSLKRIYSLIFSFVLLLLFNILRIFVLSILYVTGNPNLEIIHKTLWYSLNIIVVISIWFVSVYLFKIKKIPFYDDFRAIFKLKNYFK